MNNPTRYSMDTLQTSLMIYVIGIVIHGVQCQLSSPVLVRESETASLRWQLPAASGSFTAVYVISPSGALVLLANTLNNYQVTGNYTARVTYTGNLTADPKVMAFDLRNVVRSDAGDYICGRNGLTDIIPQCGQKLVVLGQPAKPSLNGPSAPVFGRQVTLTCSATSTTVPADHSLTLTYTWQRDNTDIIVTSPGSPFTFTVSSRDSHSYRCRARESRGLESDWSQLYNLEPQCVQCQLSSPVLVRESETASFRWQIPAVPGSFTAVYVISPSGAAVLQANIANYHQVSPDYTARVTYTGNLTAAPKVMAFDLRSVVRSDAGNYTCGRNGITSIIPQCGQKLVVLDVPEVTLSPTCQPHRVYVGQPNAQLICQVTAANPSVTSYIWTHNGSPISSATSREYSLSPVSRSSGGSYTCAGRNSVGTSSVSAVTVEVQYSCASRDHPVQAVKRKATGDSDDLYRQLLTLENERDKAETERAAAETERSREETVKLKLEIKLLERPLESEVFSIPIQTLSES
ncbi:protein sax-3-like [Haliotis asinina]|uniref:protein sax-3-like n=1 Tax=Haliotis asinina TaxID=109174 RepID=UPI003531BD04